MPFPRTRRRGIYSTIVIRSLQMWRPRSPGMNTAAVRTAPRSPWQNAYVERIIGSIRRECLDHVIVLNEAGLQQILTAYVAYYLRSRTHLALAKDTPSPRPVTPPSAGPSSLFLKSAVCITGTTGSLRSHYTAASVPATADRTKRPFNTSVFRCITADVRDLKSTGRLYDEDLHGVARFESRVPSSHFDFSVGTVSDKAMADGNWRCPTSRVLPFLC